MNKFIFKIYIYQFPFLIWAGMSVVFFIIILSGNIIIIDNINNLVVLGFPIPFNRYYILWDGGKYFLTSIFGLISLECIIAFSKPFIDLLDKKRMNLILSNAISRNDFLSGSYIGIFFVILLYSIFTIISLQFAFYLKTGTYALNLLSSLSILPFFLFSYVILSHFLSLLTGSYGITTLSLIIYSSLSSILANRNLFLHSLMQGDNMYSHTVDYAYYFLPRVFDYINIATELFSNRFLNITDFVFLNLTLILPLGISYYIINKKEF